MLAGSSSIDAICPGVFPASTWAMFSLAIATNCRRFSGVSLLADDRFV